MGKPAAPPVDLKWVQEYRRDREETPEFGGGKVKMRDLESMLFSKGIHAHPLKFLKHKAAFHSSPCGEEVTSQVTEEGLVGSGLKVADERGLSAMDKQHCPLQLDLNSDALSAFDTVLKQHAEEPKEMDASSLLTQDKSSENGVPFRSGGFSFDLNEDVPTSTSQNPFYPYKKLNQLRSKTVSECASSTGHTEEKDPLGIWNVMKRNGFLSSSHGGIPVPKQRGKKSKDTKLQKKIELAKKEEVNRFAKIAAPSGLLNDLNPGIINHVRNRKQVHAIIEALVRSERSANGDASSKQPSNWKGQKKETNITKESGLNETVDQRICYPCNNLNPSESGRKANIGCPTTFNKSLFSVSLEQPEYNDSIHHRGQVNKRFCWNPHTDSQDDALALSLSSSTCQASGIAFSVPDEDSTTLSNTDNLSVKGATISSHWLELLHQDIKARLTALRRSKKRVQAVISTELPFILSKEFSSNPLSSSLSLEKETSPISSNRIADVHGLKWTALFERMEKALEEEEQELEIWLGQVRTMQRHCLNGLQLVNCIAEHSRENLFPAEFISKPRTVENSQRELAIKAAAASIYSTCNFLLANENVSCF
ncbi:hypothetical protein MLD38_018840 [Melastoma candidum]|uniref:Uncharacterized protein n=1 Tax=Melastoma candidum TaxID=119954 RepID=A0ACB9QYJ5_9MYRT|nr:hypothetical protein MLD38_018840 [Melastoma candidum]